MIYLKRGIHPLGEGLDPATNGMLEERYLRVVKRCPSKRNDVYLVEGDAGRFVLKTYSQNSEERFQRECEVLDILQNHGLAVPKVEEVFSPCILMECLPGVTLLELSLESSIVETKKWLKKALDWTDAFHDIMRKEKGEPWAKGDATMRNFLCHGETIYGVDFEEAAPGDPLEDLGDLLANVISTSQQNNEVPKRADMARWLLEEHFSSSGRNGTKAVERRIASSLRDHAAYRQDGDALRRWAMAIEDGGLGALSKERRSE